MRGAVPISMAATGDIIGAVIAVGSSTAMYGMTLGSIPTSLIIILVGIMVIITDIILTLVSVSPDGVVEVLRHSPTIAHRLRPLHVNTRRRVPLRAVAR